MHKSLTLLWLALALQLNTTFAQEAKLKDVSLTIYNSNFGVVKEHRTVELNEKNTTISLSQVSGHIEPASVRSTFNGTILSQRYAFDLPDPFQLLEKYIGETVQLVHEDQAVIEGRLLSFNNGQAILEKPDGRLEMIPNIHEYKLLLPKPRTPLYKTPTLVWQAQAKRTGAQTFDLSYHTAGLNWEVEYQAMMNEKTGKMDMLSWVSLTNTTGTSFNNAELKLVAGKPNEVSQPNYMLKRSAPMAMESAVADESFQEAPMFEYHMYQLNRRASLPKNQTIQIGFIEARNVPYKTTYEYNAANLNQETGVETKLSFKNDERSGLGAPLPQGVIHFYQTSKSGSEFVGEDRIEHTPKNQELNLTLGQAFDVLGKTIQTEHKRISQTVHEYTYKVSLTNRKDENIGVIIKRHLGNNWKITKTTHKYQPLDANTISFEVPVKKDSQTEVTFTVRYSY